MSRKVLNPTLPGGLLTPVTTGGGNQLTAEEVALVENLQQGSYQSETPNGIVNGSNTAFTLSVAPSPVASLKLFVNGQLLTSGGVDYTLSGTDITLETAPPTGSVIRAWFLSDV